MEAEPSSFSRFGGLDIVVVFPETLVVSLRLAGRRTGASRIDRGSKKNRPRRAGDRPPFHSMQRSCAPPLARSLPFRSNTRALVPMSPFSAIGLSCSHRSHSLSRDDEWKNAATSRFGARNRGFG